MVTGDHHGAHPGFSRLLDASRDPGPRRVVDSEDAERGELGLLVIACRQLPLGDDQHAHSLLSPALAPLPEARPIGFVDESLDHLLWRALREQDAPIGGFDRDAHPLPLRVEGLHPHDVPFAEQPPGVDPVVGRCRRDRRLDRFNGSVGGPVRCSHQLVGSQQARREQLVDRFGVRHVVQRDLGSEGTRVQPGEAHPVLGDRPRLVGADDRRGPEGLDRLQPLRDRAALRHPLHPEGEGNGEHGGKPLRDRGDRQRDPDQDAVGQ